MFDRSTVLIASSAIGGFVAAFTIYNFLDRFKKQSENSARLPSSIHTSNASKPIEYPTEIKDELFSRVRSFFGEKEYNNLENSFVIVVGLGGVGSHAANMLVRSGVRKVRLVDFDQVTLSSLNRHALAAMDDVGMSKAEVMRNKLLKVVPWCNIEACTEMFKQESAERLLEGSPNIVLDCIDDISTKAELIAYCIKNDIKVLTSMGAGGKADPTRLRISTLSDCMNDPLASKIKWKLKKHNVDPEQVMSIFSVEKPICDLMPLEEEQKLNPQDYGVVDYLRLRVMPVLGTSPSIFGQAMASYVLCSIAGKMYEPEVCERMSKSLKHKMRQVFQSTEMRRFKTNADIDMDDDDIEFIVQQVWRTRCAVSSRKIGGHAPLILTRWYADQPPVPYNLVLLSRPIALLLETGGHAAMPVECLERIAERLNWAKRVCSGDWEPSKASSSTVVTPVTVTPMSTTSILSVVLLVVAQQITLLSNLTSTIPVAAMTGIFCYTAGHSYGLAQGSLLDKN